MPIHIVPAAAVLSVFWILSIAWLHALQHNGEQPATGGKAINSLGIAGAFFLKAAIYAQAG